MNTGELHGLAGAAVGVLEAGKKCFGRARLNGCGAGPFACLLEMVAAVGAEFKALMLKGDSLGDNGDGFCSCCCSSNTWLWSCCN